MIVVTLQMQSGLLQKAHSPVTAQGVFLFSLAALGGAALCRAR